ncbi:hypothetical protein MOO44_05045 [Nicoliella spurrieriana]|uniref:Uncharacterized protein n=1 Tax=Nicoliella spurrieriana TaxID=2925830 RepID=A0A976RR05_9LACO|nr:hypothetical protein [Nicoliella spurrieriana]UQS86292.1 hypothetical protein MOO44_05045 [Nicoliella spurrieriana]
MSKEEPQSRVKRYDFNTGSKQPNQSPKNFRVWPWILGLVIVIGLLVGGIKVLTNQHGNQAEQQSSAVKQSSSNHHSSAKKTSSSSSQNSQSGNNDTTKSASKNEHRPSSGPKPSNGNDGFSTPRQFSSVADATSWAKATQSNWIQAGYNNYTITSDGQGYYVLTFTK